MTTFRRLRSAFAGSSATDERARVLRLGIALYVVIALVLALLAAKPQIKALFNGGDTITMEFASQYKIRPYDSSVKMGGITVGIVTGVDDTDDGTVLVTAKIDDDVVDKLGSAPTANIEPRTLLGGRYAIELHTGGGDGEFTGSIPVERTSTPVELDTIAEALPADAREALQGLVGEAGPSVSRSSDEIARLLKDAPGVLRPGGAVLNAARGTRPDQDLNGLVTHLDSTARALTHTDGQLSQTVVDLDATARVLAAHRNELGVVLNELPQTLRDARGGMGGLAASVGQLETTATALRPSAPKLADLLVDLKPTLRIARPVLHDLVPTLHELRPAVEELVPTAARATDVLSNLRGPVLSRVNGPVMDFLLNPWVGSGPYANSAGGYQADHKLYEELAYMATNIDRASMGQDSRGSTLAFQAGVGLNSVSGTPFDIEHLVDLALDNAGILDPVLRNEVLQNAGVKVR